MCAELADLAMDLARAAASIALTDWAKPEPPPAADALPEPEVAAPTGPALAAKPPRAAGASTRTSSAKPTDPAITFTRLAACVRASITLEARLAAGPAKTTRGTSPARRADLHDAFRRVTKNHPDHAAIVRETTARVDQDLAADPDQTLDLPTIFFTICEDLDIEVDFARLPDPFLGVAAYPAGPDEAAGGAPDPRATSPP